MPVLLRREKGRNKTRLNFVDPDELSAEMNKLLEHYGAKRSQADITKTRKILGKFGPDAVNDAVVKTRDENR